MLFLILVLQCYIVGALLVFTVFLQSFWRDKTTPKNHIGSWKVLGLATILWPLVVPLACLERYLTKVSKNNIKQANTLDVEKCNNSATQPKTNNVIFLNCPLKSPSVLDGSFCPIYPNWQASSPYPIERKIQG